MIDRSGKFVDPHPIDPLTYGNLGVFAVVKVVAAESYRIGKLVPSGGEAKALSALSKQLRVVARRDVRELLDAIVSRSRPRMRHHVPAYLRPALGLGGCREAWTRDRYLDDRELRLPLLALASLLK